MAIASAGGTVNASSPTDSGSVRMSVTRTSSVGTHGRSLRRLDQRLQQGVRSATPSPNTVGQARRRSASGARVAGRTAEPTPGAGEQPRHDLEGVDVALDQEPRRLPGLSDRHIGVDCVAQPRRRSRRLAVGRPRHERSRRVRVTYPAPACRSPQRPGRPVTLVPAPWCSSVAPVASSGVHWSVNPLRRCTGTLDRRRPRCRRSCAARGLSRRSPSWRARAGSARRAWPTG